MIAASVKKMIYSLGLSPALDQFIYRFRRQQNRKENNAYRLQNPDQKIPPDYYLYETYELRYHSYFEQGDVTARELFEWTEKYLPVQSLPLRILEWGCGVARVCRHLHTYFPKTSELHGCDINAEMIKWDEENIKGISFKLTGYQPPTSYPADLFGFVYGLSVFTHIEATEQENWLKEIHRIMSPGGIFLFSTHGRKFSYQLTGSELKTLEEKGAVTKDYYQKGHRLMGTYNNELAFKNAVERYFEILEYYDGGENMDKLAGQDMWIVRKRL